MEFDEDLRTENKQIQMKRKCGEIVRVGKYFSNFNKNLNEITAKVRNGVNWKRISLTVDA